MLYDRRDCTDSGDDPEIVMTREPRRVVYKKLIDPKHPYCTNWPIPEKLDKKDE